MFEVLDAASRCVARWGVAKTTLDDVAREAGLSRAAVYRLFPGGKERLLNELVAHEVGRFGAGLAARLDATDDIENRLVTALTYAVRGLGAHPALRAVLAQEPELVLPHLAFERFDRVLATATARLAPWFDASTAEWLTRLVVSHLLVPSANVDLTDEADARRFVRTYYVSDTVKEPVPT